MGTAITVVLLVLITSTVVRIASVVLEHSGISKNVARFQALSAISGTGYTTAESEEMLRHPVRRKVLIYLIITGSVGLASVVATVIVGALNIDTDMFGKLRQLVALIIAAFTVRFIVASKKFDDFICGLAHRWLNRAGYPVQSFTVVCRLGKNVLIAEHQTRSDLPEDIKQWGLEHLQLVGVRKVGDDIIRQVTTSASVGEDEVLVLLGPEDAHGDFSGRFGIAPVRTTRHGQ